MTRAATRHGSTRVDARPLLLAGACALAAGCAAPAERTAVGPVVHDAWTRPAAAGENGAVYLTLENADTVDLQLTGVSTPAAPTATLHESVTIGGTTSMTPRPDVLVVRGATVSMRPGGLHVMLTGLVRPLAVGDSIAITLTFAGGRSAAAFARVRDQ